MQKKSKTTTIAITWDAHSRLKKLMKSGDDYDAIIKQLLNNQVDVYTEFILIDNELPQLHTVVFQLGDNKDSLFYFDGERIQTITLAETQKMMKQPRPNMTITQEEVQILFDCCHDSVYMNSKPQLLERIKLFLEQTKK